MHESLGDLIYLMNNLVDEKGQILVPGIMDDVAPLTKEEEKLYDVIDFDLNTYKEGCGVKSLIHEDKAKTLMHRWRYPSLSLHGIDGAFYGPGAKTVIPRKVVGKFSIRLVPNQTPEKIEKLVSAHLNQVYAKRQSPNKMNVHLFHGGKPWLADIESPNFLAGKRAIKHGKIK